MEKHDLQQKLVEVAKNYLGVPHVWGGETICGFDCSGLVTYVYSRLGIEIPRVTYEQYKIGISVGKENLQLGDLVFFCNLGHVGIYIGENQYINAAKVGDVVKISNLDDRNDYVGARRIISEDNKILIVPNLQPTIYIGDLKYTLYKYICSMQSNRISIKCGKFAYDRISKLNGFHDHSDKIKKKIAGVLNLNGEYVAVQNVFEKLPKRQLIISKRAKVINMNTYHMIEEKIFDDDIILEFA